MWPQGPMGQYGHGMPPMNGGHPMSTGGMGAMGMGGMGMGMGGPPMGCGGGGFGGGAGCFGGGGFKGMPMQGKGMSKGGGGGFEDEDRTRDWYCPKCRERNFVKRPECFKCRSAKPKDADLTGPPRLPSSGTTLNGMVKSYNRKGFGFLMVMGADFGQDIYYTRENLSPKLQTRDIPGQHVTFEIHRFPDGKLTALNIRPLGEDKDEGRRMPAGGARALFPFQPQGARPQEDEDRTRDWVCTGCNERNFVKRFECFKCGKVRSGFSGDQASSAAAASPSAPPARGLSPHAGSRAVREALAGKRNLGAERSRSRNRKRDQSSESESSASSQSSEKKKKKKKKSKKSRKRSRSSSSSSERSSRSRSSDKSSDCKMEEPSGSKAGSSTQPTEKGGGNDPEVEAAKGEALEQLMKLRSVEPKEARMSEWRALLRKWHPDKNPDRVEVATAVFQFLQKGKAILSEAS